MDARALLFGSRLRIAVTVLAGVGLAVGGAFTAGFLGVPAVESVENRFGDVTNPSPRWRRTSPSTTPTRWARTSAESG